MAKCQPGWVRKSREGLGHFDKAFKLARLVKFWLVL